MQPITKSTLDRLERAEWFARVGEHAEQDVVVLSSWEDAIERCKSREWENTQLGAANLLGVRVRSISVERYNVWNDIVASLKPTTHPLIHAKLRSVVEEKNLPIVFEHSVQWDILHLCIECEYADITVPDYYRRIGHWYELGHFPCGWQGDYPEGVLVVF